MRNENCNVRVNDLNDEVVIVDNGDVDGVAMKKTVVVVVVIKEELVVLVL